MSPTLIWLIPLAPLVAMIVCAVGSVMGLFKQWAHIPCWIALGISALLSVVAFWTHDFAGGVLLHEGYNWLSLGRVQVNMALQLDALSLFQLLVVTVVSFLVAIYSQAYMKGDPGYARYFAIFSGFVFSMTMLVLASNLLVMYVFWEGVGLCSYLLVGYWFQRPSAAKAATKAFLVNRVADCAFLSGILVLSYAVGLVISESSPTERLNFGVIFDVVPTIATSYPSLLGFVGVCLLIGAIGKSAQFPLHVWLPDAMEGPTPASALIHAATMVTAGVFLLARMSPLLELVPGVMVLAAWVGGITAFLAAAIALFQHDLKRVLAYSTVSQLGFMFMAVGAGAGHGLISVAVMAGMFHLFTHAFFKALLFLGAGNVMHSMGDVIDMRSFSGLRKVLPKTYVLFGIGALALAGVPPLAGFWSKDGVLAVLFEASKDLDHGTSFKVLFAVGLVTAFMTAVYTFRSFFRTFHGDLKLPPEAGDHPHEANLVQVAPMSVLAIGSVFAGVAVGPTGYLTGLFEYLPNLPKLSEHHGHEGIWLAIVSSLVSIGGVAVAWATTLKRPSESTVPATSKNPLVTAGENRFYIDEAYDLFIVRPIQAFSDMLSAFDSGFMGSFWQRLLSVVYNIGGWVRKCQAGLLPNYAIALAIGSLVLIAIIVLS